MPWSFSRRLVDLFLVSDQFQAHVHERGIAIAPSGILGPLAPFRSFSLVLSGSSSIDLSPAEQQILPLLSPMVACCSHAVAVRVLFLGDTRLLPLLIPVSHFGNSCLFAAKGKGEERRCQS